MNATNAAATAGSAARELAARLGRRGLVLVAALAVAALAAGAVLAAGRGGRGGPPADDAAALVPAGALVYVHLSTDLDRAGTARARGLASRFGSYAALRDRLVRQLSAPGCGVDARRLTHGREAALALLDTGARTAGSLVLVDTGSDSPQADRSCGAVTTAKIGRFAVVGQPETITAAKRLARDPGGSLARSGLYRRALAGMPQDRVADAYATQAGVGRLLAPQSGLIGVAGTLLQQPGLQAAGLALTAQDHGARLRVHSLLERPAGSAATRPFDPTVQRLVPSGVLAFAGSKGVSASAGRLLGLTGASTAGLTTLLGRRGGADLQPLVRLLSGEVGVAITAGDPVVLSLTAATRDEAASARDLRGAEGAIARLLKQAGRATPTWRQVGRVRALRVSSRVELAYGVGHGKVVLATGAGGVQRALDARGSVDQDPKWSKAIGKAPKGVTSLTFLDLSQLLRLGEQTGLSDSRAYLRVREDLARVQAVGVRSSGDAGQSTVELFLSIP